MHTIFLPIDTKSLYMNIYNDNLQGHTCTVATPIKQGNSLNYQLNEVYKIPKQLSQNDCDEITEVLNKKSKSTNRINNVFVFDKIKVNGEIVNASSNFCFFIKEEVDPDKVQFGRTKLHYPISLFVPEFGIDNKKVLRTISSMYHDYAFIIEGFEYDFDDDYLNFHLLVVGYNNIPYSKVFYNYKGDAANKLNSSIRNYVDIYDVEIDSLKKLYGDEVSVNNFDQYMDKANKIASNEVMNYLNSIGASNIKFMSTIYPYSLFDVQYYLDGKINYGIISATYTNVPYFNLSIYQHQFVYYFSDTTIFIVRNVGNKSMININSFKIRDLKNYEESANSLRYILKEVLG